MDTRISPISISLQPGQHLSVDSRPETAASAYQDEIRASTQDYSRLIQWEDASYKRVSHYVTSPFKQGQQRKYQDTRVVYDVGSPLKSEVLNSISLYKRNTRDISEKKDGHGYTFYSRIKKGRLLPLLGAPIVKGPRINQCIGITSPGCSKGPKTGKFTSLRQNNHNEIQMFVPVPTRKSRMHHTSLTSVYSSLH